MSRLSTAAGRLHRFALCARSAGKRQTKRNANILTYLRPLRFEPMEERALLSATVSFNHIVLGALGSSAVSPATSVYYNPSQIKTAYGIDSAVTAGSGQTIAIVDAYKDPNIATELATFDSQFSLPAPTLTVINQSGTTNLSGVSYNAGWSQEIALDVEWAHAIAPGANILLVEANSSSDSDLLAAIYQAQNSAYSALVSVVTMSWGGSEFSGETSYDSSYFTTAYGHIGVTFLASTGDDGSPGEWPAYSPNVIAVGGTSLYLNGDNTYNYETGWSGSGGGTSSQESKPSYQNLLNTTSSYRQIPDVSFDADPNTGVMVYWINNSTKQGAWYSFGGTSVAAPCWAGLIATVNQLRTAPAVGLPTLNPYGNPTQALTLLYGLAGTPSNYNPFGDFHDITSSPQVSNGSFSTALGYDEVTGIGSPVFNLLAPALVYSVTPGTPALVAAYDTGVSNSDDITSLNNGSSGAKLQFTVSNTISGATVTVYSDGTLIGSATAAGATTTVTTSGSFTLTDGSHAITVRQTESGLAQSSASSALTVTIDTTPPTVANVAIGSDQWSSSFLTYLTTLSGKNVGGYSVPVGSGAQLLTLPWTNIDQIVVTFSENVAVSQSELTLVGVNTALYDVAGGTFSYDPVHFIATWTLGTLTRPITADKLLLCLNADGAAPITDVAGNRLDGEWTNPSSTSDTGTSTYPSGNGVAGGNFDFRFNVLPGDVNQDGLVLSNDKTFVGLAQGTAPGDNGYSIFCDVNGDGLILSNDKTLVGTNQGTALPSDEPVAPAVVQASSSATISVAATPSALAAIATAKPANDIENSVAALARSQTQDKLRIQAGLIDQVLTDFFPPQGGGLIRPLVV